LEKGADTNDDANISRATVARFLGAVIDAVVLGRVKANRKISTSKVNPV
jgi:hypothetical protein